MDGSMEDGLVDGYMDIERWMNEKGVDGCSDVLETAPQETHEKKPFLVLASNFHRGHTPANADFNPPV